MSQNTDLVALGNLIFSLITTICALYLAYAALKHSARPNVKVAMLNANSQDCATVARFVFQFTNVGHWYAKPTAINVVAFFNFSPEFELIELRYGAAQEFKSTEVRVGVGKMKYLKAKGLKLTCGDEGEEVHVTAKFPEREGDYIIKVSAFSENDVSLKKEFKARCSRRTDSVTQLKG